MAGVFFRGCRKSRGGVFFVPLFCLFLLIQVQRGLGNVRAAFVIFLCARVFGLLILVLLFSIYCLCFFCYELQLIRVTNCARSFRASFALR